MLDKPISSNGAVHRGRPDRRPLSLALQGGGSHGAFTWGVLDRLLEADRYRIDAITGTSAGSVNAVALAHGLTVGDADTARDTLAQVWESVSMPMDLMLTGSDQRPSLNLLAKVGLSMTMAMSPGQFNPLGLDPLRTILTRHLDIERLRTDPAAPALYLAATNADTAARRARTTLLGVVHLQGRELRVNASVGVSFAEASALRKPRVSTWVRGSRMNSATAARCTAPRASDR